MADLPDDHVRKTLVQRELKFDIAVKRDCAGFARNRAPSDS